MTTLHLRISAFFVIVSLCAASSSLAQQPALAIGAWKLNVAKSKAKDPGPFFKSRSRIHFIEHKGDGVTVNRIETINADGSKQVGLFTIKADGTPYPMVGIGPDGMATIGTMTETIVDAHTVRWSFQNAAGETTGGGTRTVSKDGSFYTLAGIDSMLVYEKQ